MHERVPNTTGRGARASMLCVLGLCLIASGCSGKNAAAYNAYVGKVKPHVLQSDKVLAEIQKSSTSDDEMRKHADRWEKTLVDGKAALEKVTPENPGLTEMHGHLKARQQALIEGVQAMKKALGGDRSMNPVIRKKMQASTDHLTAYMKARDAFGEKYNVRFK